MGLVRLAHEEAAMPKLTARIRAEYLPVNQAWAVLFGPDDPAECSMISIGDRFIFLSRGELETELAAFCLRLSDTNEVLCWP